MYLTQEIRGLSAALGIYFNAQDLNQNFVHMLRRLQSIALVLDLREIRLICTHTADMYLPYIRKYMV